MNDKLELKQLLVYVKSVYSLPQKIKSLTDKRQRKSIPFENIAGRKRQKNGEMSCCNRIWEKCCIVQMDRERKRMEESILRKSPEAWYCVALKQKKRPAV